MSEKEIIELMKQVIETQQKAIEALQMALNRVQYPAYWYQYQRDFTQTPLTPSIPTWPTVICKNKTALGQGTQNVL